MADIRHYRNGIQVNPRDFDKAKVTIDWKGKKEAAAITIDSIQLVAKEGKALRDRILSGLSGGVGFFEGEPYRIEVGDVGNPLGVFNGFLDFSKGVNFIDECDVECSVTREQGTDWLNDVADGFSYRFLESEGIITDSDFEEVPYVINYIPDGTQLLILAISTFVLSKELYEQIEKLSENIGILQDALTPVVGVGVGAGAVVVTASDIGNIIYAALRVIIQIVYIVAIVIAIIDLVEQIIEQLMPPKRFHKGMTVKKLFEKGCEYLNLTLKSSLLDDIDKSSNKYVLIPNKGHRGGEKPTGADNTWRETGVPSLGDVFDTFGGVIRTFKSVFNADFQIVNGEFIFERRDYFFNNASYVIPDTFIDQTKLIDKNTFNTDELVANYNINYAFDLQDQNTLDNQEGRIFQAQLTPKVTINPNLTNLTGLREISIPYSLPIRKDKLTVIEEVVKAIAIAADFLTGQLGQSSSLSGKIDARIGALHLSSHFTSLPKIVCLSGQSLKLNQRDIFSARKLWDDFHFINSFKEINGVHNQYWLYQEQKIPFCFSDFVSLLDTNKVKTVNGEDAEIESIEWNVWEDFALINYRVNRLYDDNFNIEYL
jgi:hypothetical protein